MGKNQAINDGLQRLQELIIDWEERLADEAYIDTFLEATKIFPYTIGMTKVKGKWRLVCTGADDEIRPLADCDITTRVKVMSSRHRLLGLESCLRKANEELAKELSSLLQKDMT